MGTPGRAFQLSCGLSREAKTRVLRRTGVANPQLRDKGLSSETPDRADSLPPCGHPQPQTPL